MKLTRELYLSRHNHAGIPGMTEHILNEYLESDKDRTEKMYEVCDCPVCGSKYLGQYTICSFCGYCAESDDLDEYKNQYDAKLKESPDYIWALNSDFV